MLLKSLIVKLYSFIHFLLEIFLKKKQVIHANANAIGLV